MNSGTQLQSSDIVVSCVGHPFSKVPEFSGPEKLCLFFLRVAVKIPQRYKMVLILKRSKLISRNEAQWTDFLVKTCSSISQIQILKYGFGSVKVPGPSRNGPKFHLADAAFEDQLRCGGNSNCNTKEHAKLDKNSLGIFRIYLDLFRTPDGEG